MTNLPDPSQASDQTAIPPSDITATPTGNKELVGGVDRPEADIHTGGTETAIPKEVAAAGVRVHPTSIPIPAPAAQAGVQAAGKNIPPVQTPAIALPLTDDKIAQGLKQSITESWLWLAQWCVKKLKQVHLGIQTIKGKVIRVRI